MSTARIRETLHQYINEADDRFIRLVYGMMKEDKNEFVGYSADRKPLTKKDLIARAKTSNRAIEEGKVVSIEDLEKESEKW